MRLGASVISWSRLTHPLHHKCLCLCHAHASWITEWTVLKLKMYSTWSHRSPSTYMRTITLSLCPQIFTNTSVGWSRHRRQAWNTVVSAIADCTRDETGHLTIDPCVVFRFVDIELVPTSIFGCPNFHKFLSSWPDRKMLFCCPLAGLYQSLNS